MTMLLWSLLAMSVLLTAYFQYFRVRGMLYRPIWLDGRALFVLSLTRLAFLVAALVLCVTKGWFVLAAITLGGYYIYSWSIFRSCVRREMRYQYARQWYSMKSQGDTHSPQGFTLTDWIGMLAAAAVLENMGITDPFNDSAKNRILKLTGDSLGHSYSKSNDPRLRELREFWVHEGIVEIPTGPEKLPLVSSNLEEL